MTVTVETIDPNICIGNTLSTFQANFDALADAINAMDDVQTERAAFAGGLLSPSLSTVSNSFNVSGMTTLGVGKYQITFSNPLSSANYVVMLNASSANDLTNYRGQSGFVYEKTVNGFKVEWGTTSATVDPAILDFVVFNFNI